MWAQGPALATCPRSRCTDPFKLLQLHANNDETNIRQPYGFWGGLIVSHGLLHDSTKNNPTKNNPSLLKWLTPILTVAHISIELDLFTPNVSSVFHRHVTHRCGPRPSSRPGLRRPKERPKDRGPSTWRWSDLQNCWRGIGLTFCRLTITHLNNQNMAKYACFSIVFD